MIKMKKNEKTVIHKKVTYQDVDFVGQYRLANLFSTLSDLATSNAFQIGIWKEELQGQYGWILTKQTMKLWRPIYINEEVTFSTRAGKSSRVKFNRLYDIYDIDNVSIGGVYSTWTLIDIQKRKIIRPDTIGVTIPSIEQYNHAVDSYVDIKDDITMQCLANRQVVYSDLDVNQHMNNYRYIEWALDVIDYKIFTTHYISEISMVFKKEMMPLTKANIWYGKKEDYFKVRIVSEDDSNVYFEMGGYFTPLNTIREEYIYDIQTTIM